MAKFKWIQQNEARCKDIPSIIDDGTYISMTRSIYEDHFIDDPDLPLPDIIEDRTVKYKSEPSLRRIMVEKRDRNYYADIWWPVIHESPELHLPKQIMLEVKCLNDTLKTITYPAFIRGERGSPKDIKAIPCFDNPEEVLTVFTKSCRTRSSKYLLISPPYEITFEARCFIYRDKIVAVSQLKPDGPIDNTEKQEIIRGSEWLKRQIGRLPYQDLTVDIGYLPLDGKWYIIEINSYGADSRAGSALFSWHEDEALFHGFYHEPEYRFIGL